ncbi:MAG: hypothetical protein Q8M31_05425 [Beijerinckiaceae bacterium]|nr:hypothetical protein [Beijerinckiaceae bacterium]
MLPQPGEREALEITLNFGVQICRTGLVMPGQLKFEEWVALGIKLATINNGIQWAIGDHWVYGMEKKYGKRKDLAKKLPYAYATLVNWGSIAKRVKPSLRSEVVSFSHHEKVASLKPEQQAEYLKRAATNDWTVAQLGEVIAKEGNYLRNRLSEMINIPPNGPPPWAIDIDDYATRSAKALKIYHSNEGRFETIHDHHFQKLLHSCCRAASAWEEIAIDLRKKYDKHLAAQLKEGDLSPSSADLPIEAAA